MSTTAREIDVSPERLRALVTRRVPRTLLLDLAGPHAPTSEQILRLEAATMTEEP